MSIRRILSAAIFAIAFAVSLSAGSTSAVACDPTNPIGICNGDAAE